MKYLPGHVAGFRGWFSFVIILCGILGLPGLAAAQALRSQTIALETGVGSAQGGVLRTQEVALEPGWNAVYLEVNPSVSDPNDLFAEMPIDVVAAPLTTGQTAQFDSDPSVNRLHVEGWGCWYEESNPQAFLSTLFAIQGQQGYLIHCTEAYQLRVTGTVTLRDVRWKPDQFNLVGFPVVAQGPPTFMQFFEGSKAHVGSSIYRLANGSWRQVVDPSAETLRSGEAFWVFCDGPSQYQGPLRAKLNSPGRMLLAGEPGILELHNDTDFPVQPTVEHVATGAPSAPLSIIVRTMHEDEPQLRSQAVDQPLGDWSMAMPPIEVDRSQGIPLQARLEDMTLPEQSSLLRIRTDVGTELWIPVDCLRKDLAL